MTSKKAKYQPNAENIIAVRNLLASIFGTKNPTLKAVILALFVFVLAGWVPEVISSFLDFLFKENAHPILIIKLVTIVGLVIFFIYEIKRAKDIYFSPLEVRVEDNPAQAKVLLLFLSPIGPDTTRADRINMINNLIAKPGDIDKLNNFFSAELRNWSWYMPIKAIEHHLTRLERIYAITSTITFEDFENFNNLVNVYLKYMNIERKITIFRWPLEHSAGEDFSDIKLIFGIVNNFYDEMNKQNYKNNDIVVDVTGGMVPTSIGATMATLAKGRTAQYVSTMDYKVRTYDLTYREEE